MYYLRSRYYNPTWSRFINADSLIKGNLYCYCGNNPVVFIDTHGNDYTVGAIVANTYGLDYDGANDSMTFFHPHAYKGMFCRIIGRKHVYSNNKDYFWVVIDDDYYNSSRSPCYISADYIDYTYSFGEDDSIFTPIETSCGYYHNGSKGENVRIINFFLYRYLSTLPTNTIADEKLKPAPIGNVYTDEKIQLMKHFQEYCNSTYGANLSVDGLAGMKTLPYIVKWILQDNADRG